jgi:hypothetical protein
MATGQVPAVPAGVYTLLVNNNLMPGQGWAAGQVTVTTAPPATPVTLTVGTDCSGVVACVAAANNMTANGTAPAVTVFVPAGTWPMPANQAVQLGGGVALAGAGAAATVVQWDANVASGVPGALVTGVAPGTAWTVANLTLWVTSPVQRALVLDACSGCVVAGVTVNVTLDLARWPTWGPQNPIWVRSSTGWVVRNSLFIHSGNCTAASWPSNTGFYISSSEQGVFLGNDVLCYCQGWSVDSSSRLAFISDNMVSLGNDSEGDGFSSFDPARQLTNLYVYDTVAVGNPAATKRWESFTTDGPNGAFFGVLNPGDGDAGHVFPQVTGRVVGEARGEGEGGEVGQCTCDGGCVGAGQRGYQGFWVRCGAGGHRGAGRGAGAGAAAGERHRQRQRDHAGRGPGLCAAAGPLHGPQRLGGHRGGVEGQLHVR